MTDTPIKDAYKKYCDSHGYNPIGPWFDFAAGARACLTQMKPFLNKYLKWATTTISGSDEEGVAFSEMVDAYQSKVEPLLKELEDK